MVWLILTGAAGLLAYLMLRTMRGYERESATAALEEVQRLSTITDDLERRIRNLEAIATRVDAESEPPESSSGLSPISERDRVRS